MLLLELVEQELEKRITMKYVAIITWISSMLQGARE